MTKTLPPIRRELIFTPHLQHSELWYAVEDPLSGRFLRLGRNEYMAAMQFDGTRDAAAIVQSAREQDSQFALTEEDIATLTTWLLRVNFIGNAPAANAKRADAKPKTTKSIWDPLGARFPLIPGVYVEYFAKLLLPLTSLFAAVCVAILVLVAAALTIANWELYVEYSSKLFVAEGRVWWIVAWLLLKVVHEVGHAVTAVRAGSQIRSAGISFFFFAPVPFIDVSDLWSISNRWQRILCSAGGMLFEVAVSAIAVFVAFVAENDSLRYLACAIATTGTFTTLAFNANPFIRFDGYYIVSDLFQRSSLWTDGQTAVRGLVARLFKPFSPSAEPISIVFLAYGIVCSFYRIAMLVGVALWALIVWQGYGLILIAWATYAWFIAPMVKARAAAKLAASTTQTQTSPWANWWQPAVVAGLIGVGLLLPSPVQPSVPGIVVLREPTTVRSEVDGTLVAVNFSEGEQVNEGDVLAEFENPELRHALEVKQLEVASVTAAISVMRARGEMASLQGEQSRLGALNEQLAQLQKDVSELQVRAEVSGIVLATDLKRQLGRFFKPGEPLMMIARPDELELKLSASQQDHAVLRNNQGQKVRVTSLANATYSGTIEKVDMRGSDKLNEVSLAATYGGPITVSIGSKATDEAGLKLPAPRFEVQVQVDGALATELVPGQLAWARLPDSSTSVYGLFQRWISKKWDKAKLENAAAM